MIYDEDEPFYHRKSDVYGYQHQTASTLPRFKVVFPKEYLRSLRRAEQQITSSSLGSESLSSNSVSFNSTSSSESISTSSTPSDSFFLSSFINFQNASDTSNSSSSDLSSKDLNTISVTNHNPLPIERDLLKGPGQADTIQLPERRKRGCCCFK